MQEKLEKVLSWMKSISLEEQRNPNFLNRDSNTNEIQTQCSVRLEQFFESRGTCAVIAD